MKFNFYGILKKIACFVLIVICVGLPAISVFSFAVIFIAGLAIVNGKVNHSYKRLVIASFIAIFVLVIKGILPHAAIHEGHNIFFIKGGNETMERELPPEAFAFMKQQFLKKYPLDKRTVSSSGCWQSRAPQSLFVFSADSAFSKPKYSRIVDSINFNNLTEFRGGFANDSAYAWFGASDIRRDSMPFFVMYELSPSSVNSSLCWTGYVLWEGADWHYQAIYNETRGCRKITDSDIGKKVFGVAINNKEQPGFWGRFKDLKSRIRLFLSGKKPAHAQEESKETPLSMSLILSPALKFSVLLKRVLDVMGALFVFNLMVKIDRKRFLIACLIIVIAAAITYIYCPHLFGQYYIHEGGEDGPTHETLGRQVLVNALLGHWKQALRGGEDIFWNTPGFRYFRASEKLFFGDTDFGYLVVVLILPYVLFGFLANFISERWSFWITMFFLFGVFLQSHMIDRLGFTYYIYVMVVRGGWPDTLAYTAFLGALTLLLRYAKARDGAYYWYGLLAHFLLFVTVFMRPQFSIAALLVLCYFAGKLMMAGRFKEVFFSWLGFTPVLFTLLHNFYFGRKFCVFTAFAQTALSTPPSLYLDAFKELLVLNLSGGSIAKVAAHLKIMISPWYRTIFLGLVFYAAFLKRKMPPDMRMIAVVCLSLHFINLFIFAVYFRYVFLAWALTVVVAIFLLWLRLAGRKEKVVL